MALFVPHLLSVLGGMGEAAGSRSRAWKHLGMAVERMGSQLSMDAQLGAAG